jgi:hypothetical protein
LEFILINYPFLRGSGGGWNLFDFGGMGSGWGRIYTFIFLLKSIFLPKFLPKLDID